MRVTLFTLIGFTASASAQLAWDQREITLTPAPGAISATANFPFKNTGQHTVAIQGTHSSCGCIVIGSESTKRYAPGASGEIVVEYRIGERIGAQQTYISVTTDDPTFPTTVLTLKVNIPTILDIDPPALIWRQNEPAAAKRAKITPNPAVPIKILDVQPSDPSVSATLEAPAEDGARSLLVTPGDTSKLGFRLVTLRTDFPPGKPRSFYVYVRIEPDTPAK